MYDDKKEMFISKMMCADDRIEALPLNSTQIVGKMKIDMFVCGMRRCSGTGRHFRRLRDEQPERGLIKKNMKRKSSIYS